MSGLIGAVWAGAATLLAPGLQLMLRRRAMRGKEIAARLPERQGIDPTPRPGGTLVWVHAASVGESQSMLPVIMEWVRDPAVTVLVTTGTVTSAALLDERVAALGLARVLHRFVPLDVPRWVLRFVDHWRPDVAVFVESELWPNLLAACRARGVPLMLVNGRMSERSLRGWLRAPGFARAVVGVFDVVHPQSEADGARLRRLGARGVMTAGNLKLAAGTLAVDAGALASVMADLGRRPVWLAASTHPGEEAVAAEVHRALAGAHPGLVTIIVPRHPARGAEVAAAVGGVRRGRGPPAGGIWVVDTLGELGLMYRVAPIVFVGRSLVARGGQNPLEPARLECAIAMGPHVGNFEDAVARLRAAGALATVADAAALAEWVGRMLADPVARAAMGAAARKVASGEADLPARVARWAMELAG